MMATCEQMLLSLLDELDSSSVDIQAAAIVSSNGLIMAAKSNDIRDQGRLSALTVAMTKQADRTVVELRRGRLEQILIKGDKGHVLMLHAGERALLTVMLKTTLRLGWIFFNCRRCAEKIARSGIAKPTARTGLVYLGKRNSASLSQT